ncbi:MAG: NADPH:quinone oxidoreductase family protein, partial [Comamonadaceae bacterium]
AVPLPFVPGNEVAGVVRAVGPGVTRLAVGERVNAIGVGGKYAQACNVAEAAALRIPDSLSFEQAAVFRSGFGCAYHALVQGARLQPGEAVLVLGAGGSVGLAAVQLAHAFGARVLASASGADKRDLALRAGADAAIDSQAGDWRAQVRQFAGDAGIDIVVDPVGGRFTEPAFRTLGGFGRHLMIGFAAGEVPKLPANLALVKAASFIGIEQTRFEARFPALAAANDRALFALYERGAIAAPPVMHRFAFEDFREAFRMARSGRPTGSIVLCVEPATA